jgi:hypothetical protein
MYVAIVNIAGNNMNKQKKFYTLPKRYNKIHKFQAMV